jgi:putative hydrolase
MNGNLHRAATGHRDPLSGSNNAQYADRLREAAALLESQGANSFRISAYRKGARTILDLDEDVAVCLEREGPAGLEKLPNIGRGIASALQEMVRTGHWMQLERLRGSADPVQLLTTVPGLGHRLAERIHEELHIDTLEALEVCAHNGRLETVPGVGPRRAAAIRASLQSMLSRVHPRRYSIAGQESRIAEPPVNTLLKVDHEYRDKAASGKLPTIAPRRFNPTGEHWLPLLHADTDSWHFTAMYSNTALAHNLGRTRDWVVIYYYDSEHAEGQCTVVTETHGSLTGKRVVRGRERECEAHYEQA